MVLYEILTCCVPFDEPDINQRTVNMIDLVCKQKRRPPIHDNVLPEFKALLQVAMRC